LAPSRGELDAPVNWIANVGDPAGVLGFTPPFPIFPQGRETMGGTSEKGKRISLRKIAESTTVA